jgi:hypothetical protein
MYDMGGRAYVCYGWPCICMLGVTLYMYTMGGPVYVYYGWPCICMLRWPCICRLWVTLYMYAMGGPVYVYYAWPCICILWLTNLPVSTIFILYFENLLMLGFLFVFIHCITPGCIELA